MTWVVTAIVASSVVTSAYGAQQAKKRQKKATEQQNVRDLIEGSAPNISNVQEVIVDELQGSDPGALEDALAAMDYQAQGEVPIPGEAGVPSAAGDMSQMTEEEALQLLQEQSGIMMARGGPIGTPNDTYYFDVGNIMNMMTDANPQIQSVGMQLADQMTSNPGMSMVPATRDQIRGMAYGGQVEPKKLADGDVVDEFSVADLGDGLYDMRRLGSDGRHSQYREITYERPLREDEGGWPAERVREFEERQELFGKLATPYILAGEEIPDEIKRLDPELPVEYPPVRIVGEQASRQSSKPYYDDGGVVTDPDPMKEVLKELAIGQVPIVSQIRLGKETYKDVKEAEGLEKLAEVLDVLPVNPWKLGRRIRQNNKLRRAEKRAAEEEAKSRVFGPR